MKRKNVFSLAAAALLAFAATSRAQTVDDVIAKNIQAHGGLEKLKAIKSLRTTAKFSQGSFRAETVQENKRPEKVREEFIIQGMAQVQAYDGKTGWQVNPFGGRKDAELMAAEDMKSLIVDSDIDGPLVDYASKGNKVQLDGTETVEGRPCYRLQLTLGNGQVRHVWIDAQTFLELKMEGSPRRMDGRMRMVTTYMREYKSEGGLMIPHVLETAVEAGKKSHKMTIQAVAANAALDDSLFSRPAVLVAASPLK